MSMNNISLYRSPCEVLRKLNDLFQGDTKLDKEVRALLAESELKSKNMSIALHKYEPNFYKTWDKNKNINNNRKDSNYKYVQL